MSRLKTILVGAGGMGGNQARIIGGLPMYELAAVVDLRAEAAAELAATHGAKAYTDLGLALIEQRPEVVAICTSNKGHAGPCIQAAEFGVRGIYCEKPMAVDLDDARAMVAACDTHGTKLVINHQRRTGVDLRAMKAAIDDGRIGRLRRLRFQNAGDLLSDGTHGVDSMLYLMGETDIKWVMAQLHREDPTGKQQPSGNKQDRRPGWRFGHPVEDGICAEIQFAGGIRGELLCGDAKDEFTAYQCYELTGSTGSILRWGDPRPDCGVNVFIDDGTPGSHELQFDQEQWIYRPMPSDHGGGWQPLIEANDRHNLIIGGYERLAAWIAGGPEHPMNGRVGLRDMELITAIYESARLGTRITPPVQQETFPLALMIDEHETATL